MERKKINYPAKRKSRAQQWAVYGRHLNPLFKGPRSEVARFLLMLMREDTFSGPWRVERHVG